MGRIMLKSKMMRHLILMFILTESPVEDLVAAVQDMMPSMELSRNINQQWNLLGRLKELLRLKH